VIKAAAVQLVITQDPEANLSRAAELTREAAAAGAQLICLPEYFVTDCPEQGMTPDRIAAMAETIPGPTTERLGAVARRFKVYVAAGTIIERREGGRLYNTCALLGPDGQVVGVYSKTHPEDAPPKHEKGCGLTPGDEFPVFDTAIGKVGVMIDMDITAPEAARILAVGGAEIVCWPLNWSARWFHVIETLPAAHAIMDKLYIVVANRVGPRTTPFGSFLYNGGSRVVSPEGFTIARAHDFREGTAAADLDLELLHQWRAEIIPRDYPYRRRPEIYGDLVRS